MRAASSFGVAAGWILLLAGCASLVPYTPDARLVPALGGLAAANRELEGVCLRAVDPPIQGARVSGGLLRLRTVWFLPFLVHEIPLERIDSVRIYSNHAAFLIGPGERPILRILFESEDQCRRFADLLMSLKAAEESIG